MRSVTIFNDGWLFEGKEQVTLPHTAAELPFSYFDESQYWRPFTYEKTVAADPAWAGKEVSLLFDGAMARKGYALNKMCFSFNAADNREAFRADEEGYMRRYGLTEEQARAIRDRDVPGLLAAGGNVYYLAKFAGILGLDVQDLGAAQTGMTKEAFKAMLVRANDQPAALAA